MANEQDITRDYNMEDNEMLQRAQLFHNNFVIDSTAIIAAFPSLASPFITTFQTNINTADAFPSDEEEQGWITIKVDELTVLCETAREQIQECYSYVKEAFNDNQAYNNLFGRGRIYNDAKASYIKTKELLERVHRNCENTAIKATMIAAGYTQGKIDALETTMESIDEKIVELDELKNWRPLKTYQRITAYNTVWASMVRISEAAKTVFADNPSKLTQYQLYPSSTTPHKVQNLQYNTGLNLLTWVEADNATLYVIEAMMQAPINMPNFDPVGESPTNEWAVVIVPGTYAFRVKGKNGGLSGPYSDYIDGIVITP